MGGADSFLFFTCTTLPFKSTWYIFGIRFEIPSSPHLFFLRGQPFKTLRNSVLFCFNVGLG